MIQSDNEQESNQSCYKSCLDEVIRRGRVEQVIEEGESSNQY